MARPKKAPHEIRSARLPAVRLTEAERIDLETKAEAMGLELSDWVRQRLLSAKVTPAPAPIDAAVVTELNRIGVNLNQIARALNRGRDEDPHHIGHVLHLLNTTLERVARRYGS